MRKNKWFIFIISGLLVFASFPLPALADQNTDREKSDVTTVPGKYSSKDEVIYVNLDANGKTKNMYVVNTFHVTEPGEIVDYGNYLDVKNLTDLSPIEKARNEEVHFEASEEEFYYQGELKNEPLPWDISMAYFLDGKEMKPDQLAGQSGRLEIHIPTAANEHVNPLFFEHFLLQVSLTLDPKVFRDIQAPKGTEANEGKNKQITFSVMPEQEEILILTAHVTDFEMDPIQIAAIPANIAIEDPDLSNMTSDMKLLSDAIREINSGVAELNDGIAELNDGATELSSGSTEYRNGINELDQSSGELVNGSQEIRDILRQVSGAVQDIPEIDMPDLEDLKTLPKSFRDLAKELQDFAEGLEQLEQVIQEIPDDIDTEQINELYDLLEESNIDASVLDQLVKAYETGQIVKEINEAIPADLTAIITNMANHLETLADGLEDGMENLDELEDIEDLMDLQDGLMTLSSEYDTFHNGLVSYTSGVNSLATSYQALDKGIQGLASGTSSLRNGVGELYEGTEELQKSTSGLPNEMQSKLEEFMEEYDFSDYEAASFISDQNEDIGVVQFVLQTERIEVEEPEAAPEEEEETKSLWDRFIDLFNVF